MNGPSVRIAALPVAQKLTRAGDVTERAGFMTSGVWGYDAVARSMVGTPKVIGAYEQLHRSGDENV